MSITTLAGGARLELDQVDQHLADLRLAVTPRALYRAACDAFALRDAVEQLAERLTAEHDLRLMHDVRFAALVEAARAAVAAGDVAYVHAWLAHQGMLPAAGTNPHAALADAGVIAELIGARR